MIGLPVDFDLATFVANNVTLGVAMVGIGVIFYITQLVIKLIFRSRSVL